MDVMEIMAPDLSQIIELAKTNLKSIAQVYNVQGYGAKGDGVTDDTAAIQAAINAAKLINGTVFFPPGTYILSQTLDFYKTGVSLVGSGSGFHSWININDQFITRLKWTGGLSPMIRYKTTNVGVRIRGLLLDCNNLASDGLVLDGTNGFMIDDITILQPKATGLTLKATELTCSWNSFRNLTIEALQNAGTKGIWLTGTPGGGNACHNTFIQTKINFGGNNSHGIYLGNCDNNAFYDTYEFRDTGGNGNGVFCDPNEASGFPIANWFYHLQSSAGGWFQLAGVGENAVIGYATDNGQPDPALNGGELVWLDMRGRMHPIRSLNGRGSKPGSNLSLSSFIPANVSFVDIVFPQGNEPDVNYAVFYALATNPSTSNFWTTNKTVSGFRVNISTPLPYDVFFTALIVR